VIEVRALKYVILAAIPLLVLSSLLDLMLWFTRRFYVPSWTVSVLGFCCAVLCSAIYVQLYGSSQEVEDARPPRISAVDAANQILTSN